jgi:hypothetical protein
MLKTHYGTRDRRRIKASLHADTPLRPSTAILVGRQRPRADSDIDHLIARMQAVCAALQHKVEELR